MSDQFDPTKPCKTRSGNPVRIYATDGAPHSSIHGAHLAIEHGGWVSRVWDYSGRVFDARNDRPDRHHPCDLVNVTPDVVWYHPVFTSGTGARHDTHAQAMADGRMSILCGSFLAILKITVRDGREVSVEVEHV